MKTMKQLFLMLTVALFVASCSSDDDGGTNPPTNPPTDNTGNYFPSTVDDLWIYNVINTNPDDSTFDFERTDAIEVNSGTSASFTLMSNPNPANGSMNTFLSNGTLSRSEDMLFFSGDLTLPAEFGGFSDATITLTDVALYDLNAQNGELSSTIGNITEDFDLDGTNIPLNINYNFTTSKLNTGSTLTVDGTEYSDVIKGNLTLEVTVTATIDLLGTGTPTTVSILSTQDILTIDYYFAKDIGLIQANATQGYEVNPSFIELLELIPGFELTIPTSVTVTNDQEIDSFIISE